jgi:hypothetical protein
MSRQRSSSTMNASPNHPGLNGLIELSKRSQVDIRPTLLRVMTDLYVQKPMHSAEEERHFTELALRLIDLVEAPTRALVADKLGRYPNAPAAVRRRLLREQISVKAPVTESVAPSGGRRTQADELSELFFAANAEERRLILQNLPYAPLSPAPPIAAVIARGTVARLEAAALGHNADAFARELERAFAISRAQARALIEDGSGEPLVVVAVALGMPAAVLQRILLCLNPAISQSVQRVYDLALLHEEVEPAAAMRLVAIWQASHRAQQRSAAAKPKPPPHPPAARAAPQPRPAPAAPAAPPVRPKIRWEQFEQARKADSA